MKEEKVGKKSYEKPAVESEKILEAAALACGKIVKDKVCQSMKKVS